MRLSRIVRKIEKAFTEGGRKNLEMRLFIIFLPISVFVTLCSLKMIILTASSIKGSFFPLMFGNWKIFWGVLFSPY